jgi:hypothetical protein
VSGSEERGDQTWPAVMRVRPEVVFTNVAVVVAVSWVAMLLFDVVQVTRPWPTPMWVFLFNDGLVEWLQ